MKQQIAENEENPFLGENAQVSVMTLSSELIAYRLSLHQSIVIYWDSFKA